AEEQDALRRQQAVPGHRLRQAAPAEDGHAPQPGEEAVDADASVVGHHRGVEERHQGRPQDVGSL
ncbi:MAG: LSU ribosomal protein L35p, partial [uncultured Nocardioidaceae bacterium]